MPRTRFRLRRQLVLLALLTVLPALALAVHNAMEQRQLNRGRAEREADRLVHLAVGEHHAAIETLQHLLAGMAFAPEFHVPAHPRCEALARDLVQRWGNVDGLGVFDTTGTLACAALADGRPVGDMPPSARAFVQRVLARGRGEVGRMLMDPVGRHPVLMLGQPLRDAEGRPTGVLSAVVHVRWPERFGQRTPMPPATRLLLVGPTGQLLHHGGPGLPPDAGGRTEEGALFAAIDGRERGLVEHEGGDGHPRVFAFARLPGPPEVSPYVLVGLSRRQANTVANQTLQRNLLQILGMAVVTLVIAAVVGELLVMRRMRPLLAATERIAAGDFSAPVPLPRGDGELGRIGDALDRMVHALREREEETRRAVASLRVSEERHRSIVLGTSQIVWSADAHGLIVEDLPSWRAVTGQTPEQVLGAGWLDALHPDDREAVATAWQQAVAHRQPYAAEFRLRTASGEYRPYGSHGVPIFAEDGATIREWVGLCVDLSERRAAEEALRRAEESRREGQKLEAVGRLAGGVAHDFNNLLTAITSYAQLLLDEPELAPAHRDDVAEIRKAADRAAALVRQLLAFSRRQPVQPTELELNDVVRDVETMLRRLIGVDYELVLDLAPDGGRVVADRSQLEQIVVNLVLNARDAMPGGGCVRVTTAVAAGGVLPAGATGRHLALGVHDEGVGMDEATRARIFEPFFTTKSAGTGTGLGLATVYGAVQQAGGHIAVRSAPGRGTSVVVYLPVVEGARVPVAARRALEHAGV